MANTQLTQTGAQVQEILDKADKLPASLGTTGQVLAVNSGATGTEWQTPSSGGFTLEVTNAGEHYWVFFADGTGREYSAGTTGIYKNAIAIGIDPDTTFANETGFHLYFAGTGFVGGTLPLSAFIGALPSGMTKLRLLLTNKTCSIVAD